MIMKINKVGILGSGVMGSQIAAVFANAKIPTLLFGYDDAVKGDFDRIGDYKPATLTHIKNKVWITPAGFEKDLGLLSECDLIIEAIVEDLDAKQQIFEKILPYLHRDVILASNTSSLSVNDIGRYLDNFKPNFCGVHFFNPPRYMPLVELIPTTHTSKDILNSLEGFLTSELGKNIIYAEDNTGFIANRIGMFSLASCLHHATRLSIDFDAIDALTGTKVGRPKSATFRTADLVGLDILRHVFESFYKDLTNDPWRHYFKTPNWLDDLIESGSLGAKSGIGIYHKDTKGIHVFSPNTGKYSKAKYEVDESVKDILKQDMSKWISLLKGNPHKDSQFLYYVIKDTCLYSAYHLPDIAMSCRDIDLALHWGFGWDIGIFELWQSNGIHESYALFLTDRENYLESEWIESVESFYTNDGSYVPDTEDFIQPSAHKVYDKQLYRQKLSGEAMTKYNNVIFENDSSRLFHDDDGIAIFSMKTKLHTLNLELIHSLKEAIGIAERDFKAIIIWQDSAPFSAGANLYEIVATAKLGMIEHQNLFTRVKQKAWHLLKPNLPNVEHLVPISEVIELLQETLMGIKYCKVPVVAAVEGLAIGGGCELLLHCNRRVVYTESYIGLVEIGVGLLPAGGGCKEMVLKASKYDDDNKTLLKYFEQIALGKISESAEMAVDMGYLEADDIIVSQRLELLYYAKQHANQLASQNYRPECRKQTIKTAGASTKANVMVQLTNMKYGEFISPYDYFIAEKIADVMCGGDVDMGTEVDSEYFLKLEKTHFIELLKEDKTQDRIEHMLLKHKPLRN
jgi:3-hydroxyacyl-CoA dehydrogenase